MTQTQFSILSAQLTEAAHSDPFSDKHLELHGLYHAALTQSFDEGQLEALEANYQASEDYRHSCAFASF
jgi:hypothetical protein